MTAHPEVPADPAARFRVGTLQYTKTGLFFLFSWMLWGVFCFTLMEMVFPKLMPLQLKAMGASSFGIGLLVGTLPTAMNFFITPVVSFRSDRFRSRLGRRIPFLMIPTPFVALFLVLLGYSKQIADAVAGSGLGGSLGISPASVALLVVGLLVIGFQLFNMFVSSVYYYLFNDVVPQAFLGRFMALFQMVASAAGFLFNFFIFGWAEKNMQQVFLWAALLYFVVFTLMCWRVKEGEYPPPPEIEGRPGIAGQVKTYFRECFSHPIYLWLFGGVALWNAANAVQMFFVFFAKDIGMSMDAFGKAVGVGSLVAALVLYPIGSLVDRFGPLRVLLLGMLLYLPCQLFFLLFVWNGGMFIGAWLASSVAAAFFAASQMPLYMALLPRDRFGQFCSAGAMLNAVVMLGATALSGIFLDLLGNNYRYIFIWMAILLGLAIPCLFLVHRHWIRLGGPGGYVAPLPAALPPQQP